MFYHSNFSFTVIGVVKGQYNHKTYLAFSKNYHSIVSLLVDYCS